MTTGLIIEVVSRSMNRRSTVWHRVAQIATDCLAQRADGEGPTDSREGMLSTSNQQLLYCVVRAVGVFV